ncbi:hypothetical protein J6TS2_48290 [Heyndrickxia sporothermodurans]|nr:hypothetical protein J6TS2_48290 [Heyndrickxia sporothermodurans]
MELQKGNVYIIFNKFNYKVLIGEGADAQSRLSQHRSNLKRGIERNKSLLVDYNSFGEDAFEFEIILKSIDSKLCESLLIELFSRVDMAYNKRDRSSEKIRKIEKGEFIVPSILYREIGDFILRWEQKFPYFNYLLNELKDMRASFESKSEEIYNRDFKKSFLTNYSDYTQIVTKQLFKKSYTFENELGKDLYNFTFEEAEKVLCSLEAGTIRSFQNLKSTLSKYLEFAIKQGVSNNKENYYESLRNKKNIFVYINKEKEENMIFDKDELMEMAMGADNFQDGVIPALIFDGVSHKKKNGEEFWELVNLTKDDIDFENGIIKLEDRDIPMSKGTEILVKRALDDDTYYSINGETVRKYKLAESNHVLRGVRKGREKINWRNINQRIIRIAEMYDYEYLNATTISYSGQLHYSAKLIEEEGKTLDEVIPIILERFGVPDNPSSQHNLKNNIQKYMEG